MKARKLLMLMASIGLVFSLMTGCGGGGDGDTPATTPGAELEPEKVNDFVGEISDAVGCSYTTVATAQIEPNKQLNATLSFKTVGVITNVIVREDVLKYALETSRSAKITETAGDCGGTMEIDQDDSNTSLTITFDEYCNSEAVGVQAVLDGSVDISISQTEMPMVIAASTPIPLNIKTTNPNTSENMDVTISLQSGQVTINGELTAITAIAATASLVSLTDNITQKSCTITDVNANVDMVDESATFSAGVDCTDLGGKVDVSGTVDSDGQGTVTLTDANGKKAILSTTSTEGVFDVSLDNAQLGTMDCSDVNVTIPEL